MIRILFLTLFFNLIGCQKVKDKVLPFFEKTREQRLIDRYGYCEPAGYGFLMNTVPQFLADGFRPEIRYFDFDQKTHYWFNPPRLKVDSNFLIGVGFPKESIEKLTKIQAKWNPAKKLWTFQTGTDFDILESIDFTMSATDSAPVQIEVLNNAENGTLIFSKAIPVVRGLNKLEAKINHFSYSMGDTFFAVRFSGKQPETVDIQLKALDLEKYTILKQEGSCFLAQNRQGRK